MDLITTFDLYLKESKHKYHKEGSRRRGEEKDGRRGEQRQRVRTSGYTHICVSREEKEEREE